MKRILSITCIAILLMLGFNTYAQSTVTWIIKDKPGKGYFKTHTTINSKFSGFSSKEESDKFVAKIKANPDVASFIVSNTDAKGNCDAALTMKASHDKTYYANFAKKVGIAYIQVNDKKKTPAEISRGQ